MVVWADCRWKGGGVQAVTCSITPKQSDPQQRAECYFFVVFQVGGSLLYYYTPDGDQTGD